MKKQFKLKKYKESKYFQLYRNPIPGGINNESDWLRCALQPFDTIIEYTDDAKKAMLTDSKPYADGLYVKDMYAACPICGCREVDTEHFNDLEPEALAGSAGFYMICKECGYKYRVVTMMS
jgi:hypothetical protein